MTTTTSLWADGVYVLLIPMDAVGAYIIEVAVSSWLYLSIIAAVLFLWGWQTPW